MKLTHDYIDALVVLQKLLSRQIQKIQIMYQKKAPIEISNLGVETNPPVEVNPIPMIP
jgi:hypothetical protein